MSKRSFQKKASIIVFYLIILFGINFLYAQRVPAPKEILGFEVGADYNLASYEQAIEYFRALEKASPKIKLFEAGKTSMGRPMIYAVISAAMALK